MAEIFGAVASGAGLLSLSMQLMEAAQKLKAFYDASREAPEAIDTLCFELETMSLSLSQLERFRRKEVFGNELLERCVSICERAVRRMTNTLDKIEALSRRSRFSGRITVAFKEPEIEKQLRDLERAKTTLMFAYMQFRDSYNEHEAKNRLSILNAQSVLLSKVVANSALMGGATITEQSSQSLRPGAASSAIDHRSLLRKPSHAQPLWSARIKLPAWFVKNVWDISLQRYGESWNLQLRPIIHRPLPALIQMAISSGSVRAVRKLLWAQRHGISSAHDADLEQTVEVYSAEGSRQILRDAIACWQHDICAFLLTELSDHIDPQGFPQLLEDSVWYGYGIFDRACREYMIMTRRSEKLNFEQRRQAVGELYQLFSANGALERSIDGWFRLWTSMTFRSIDSTYLEHIGTLLDHTFTNPRSTLSTMTIRQRFLLAMRSQFWPADSFSAVIGVNDFPDAVFWTDENGRTALHWAAEHYAMSVRAVSTQDRGSIKVLDNYSGLVSLLLIKGADPNARDNVGRTPLVRMFSPPLDDDCFLSTRNMEHKIFVVLLRGWGDLIFDSGEDAEQYVATENKLYAEMPERLEVVTSRDGTRFRLQAFALDDSHVIHMVGERSVLLQLWEEVVVPGSWKSSSPILKISWNPYLDKTEGLYSWHQVSSVNLLSSRLHSNRPWTGTQLADLQHEGDNARYNTWRNTQDDHGPRAMAGLPYHQASLRNRKHCARRALSLPRERPRFIPSAHSEDIAVKGHDGQKIHKCPLDEKWKGYYGYDHLWPGLESDFEKWRVCKRGECDGSATRAPAMTCLTDESMWLDAMENGTTNMDVFQRFWAKYLCHVKTPTVLDSILAMRHWEHDLKRRAEELSDGS